MSTLLPHVRERLLTFATAPGKFIPPASAYHLAPNIIPSPSNTTIPFEAIPRVVRPASAAPFWPGRRVIHEPVLRLELAASVELAGKRAPQALAVAFSSRSRRRSQQVDPRGHSSRRFSRHRSRPSRSEDPFDDLAVAHARRSPAASPAVAEEMRFDRGPLRVGHRNVRTGHAPIPQVWCCSAPKRTRVNCFVYNVLKRTSVTAVEGHGLSDRSAAVAHHVAAATGKPLVAKVIVRDNGIRLDAAHSDRVFEAFLQANPKESDSGFRSAEPASRRLGGRVRGILQGCLAIPTACRTGDAQREVEAHHSIARTSTRPGAMRGAIFVTDDDISVREALPELIGSRTES
jgi:hypothetical protein